MENKSDKNAISYLEQLNIRIGEAEFSRDADFLNDILADELVFRRANGTIVTKEFFLTELKKLENTFTFLHSEDIKVAIIGENSLVSLIVHTKGRRGEAEFEGRFRNLRIFIRREDKWQCIVWFNTKIE
jgi:hypothetical protein